MILSENEFLCMEGETSNALYIVKSGLLEGSSTRSSRTVQYGPGSLIGEFGLLEGMPNEQTLIAKEDSEVLVVDQNALNQSTQDAPNWLKSILTFLAGRFHIAQENKKKNTRVKALPSLLYVLKERLIISSREVLDSVPLFEIQDEMQALYNTSNEETEDLLLALQNLDVLKIQNEVVRVESPRVIGLLYDTIMYRALYRKVSPNILSMTEQMVLSVIKKAVQENLAPLKNGSCIVYTETMKAISRKEMHGMTLTMRIIQPLVQRGLLTPSTPSDLQDLLAPIESIEYFSGDMDKIFDMLEVNRIFPLLDKKLVD